MRWAPPAQVEAAVAAFAPAPASQAALDNGTAARRTRAARIAATLSNLRVRTGAQFKGGGLGSASLEAAP